MKYFKFSVFYKHSDVDHIMFIADRLPRLYELKKSLSNHFRTQINIIVYRENGSELDDQHIVSPLHKIVVNDRRIDQIKITDTNIHNWNI